MGWYLHSPNQYAVLAESKGSTSIFALSDRGNEIFLSLIKGFHPFEGLFCGKHYLRRTT
jgi:hypothetical protein